MENPLPSFVVSLMPFERQLLAEVASADHEVRAILGRRRDNDLRTGFGSVFEHWGPVVAARKAVKTVTHDLRRAVRPGVNFKESLLRVIDQTEPEFFSQDLRGGAFQAFFRILETPRDTNSCRAQKSKTNNPSFKDSLLSTDDVLKFFESMIFSFNEDDWGSWKILLAMFIKCPDQMGRWILDVPRVLHFFTYERNIGFEILNVVRMYFIHLARPQTQSTLLQLCESHGDLGSRLWSCYRAEQVEFAQKCGRFLSDSGIAAFLGVDVESGEAKDVSGSTIKDPSSIAAEVFTPSLHCCM